MSILVPEPRVDLFLNCFLGKKVSSWEGELCISFFWLLLFLASIAYCGRLFYWVFFILRVFQRTLISWEHLNYEFGEYSSPPPNNLEFQGVLLDYLVLSVTHLLLDLLISDNSLLLPFLFSSPLLPFASSILIISSFLPFWFFFIFSIQKTLQPFSKFPTFLFLFVC